MTALLPGIPPDVLVPVSGHIVLPPFAGTWPPRIMSVLIDRLHWSRRSPGEHAGRRRRGIGPRAMASLRTVRIPGAGVGGGTPAVDAFVGSGMYRCARTW